MQKKSKSRDGSYLRVKYDQNYDAYTPNQFSINVDEAKTVGETEAESQVLQHNDKIKIVDMFIQNSNVYSQLHGMLFNEEKEIDLQASKQTM